MSHKNIDDIDKQRIDWDGPERFSDKCDNCGHSRADHLAVGVLRPVGARTCTVMLCEEMQTDTKNVDHKHTKDDCHLVECNCEQWEKS